MSSHGPPRNFFTFRERLNQLKERVEKLESAKSLKDLRNRPQDHYLHAKRLRGYNPFRSFWVFACKTGMSGQFCFPRDCLYPHSHTNELNKLIGFSFTHHHYQSVRLAWRPKEGSETLIEVFLYTYTKGELEFWKIQDCEVNRVYSFVLQQGPTTFGKVIDTDTLETRYQVQNLDMKKPYLGYVNFPYFADKGPPHPLFVYVSYTLS
jgi:hypothetical protein